MARFTPLLVLALFFHSSAAMSEDKAPADAAPSKAADIRAMCTKQSFPAMPREAVQAGVQGTVKASIKIVDGVVKEVWILSGPRVFHEAVRTAIMSYQCEGPSGVIWANQEFVFALK